MNKVVRISESHGGGILDNYFPAIVESHGGGILDNYFPAIVKWSEDTRANWQTAIDTNSHNAFAIFLEIGHTGQTGDFVVDSGWWFSYQSYVEIEFEDGTIKAFATKHGDCFSNEPESYKELIDFIDNYVNNGYELTDKTAVVLDDEDDLLVV